MHKRVAIICEYAVFPERVGGMDRFFVAFDKVLKEKGYQVAWFFKTAKKYTFYENLKIFNAEGKNLESFFLKTCNASQLKFDIVITHFLQPVSLFYKHIKNQQNAYIISVDHNPRPLLGTPIKKLLKNRVKGMLYSNFVDSIVGVSKYTTNQIVQDFGRHIINKTKVVYNGIDYSIFNKQIIDRKNKPINFIVVSHLRKSKGIQDLIKAVNLIDKKLHKNIAIDIYGEGPFREKLIQLSNDYKLENVISFKGSSPNINSTLYKYHYLIQPTYMECFSLSILESLASNVPVITTTVGGNTEIIENNFNGFLFKAKDILKLSEILEDIVTGKKAILGNVRNEIEVNYTLRKMVDNHLNLLPCT